MASQQKKKKTMNAGGTFIVFVRARGKKRLEAQIIRWLIKPWVGPERDTLKVDCEAHQETDTKKATSSIIVMTR